MRRNKKLFSVERRGYFEPYNHTFVYTGWVVTVLGREFVIT